MTSTAVLVGIPNVGKSSIFNRLTQSKQAIISETPGTTRDRCYGFCENDAGSLLLIDTGGLTDNEATIQQQLNTQVWLAIEEADIILFVVDSQTPVSEYEVELGQKLRQSDKQIILVANKTDSPEMLSRCDTDYYRLGFKRIQAISAKTNWGTNELLMDMEEHFQTKAIDYSSDQNPHLSIIGRPNSGKSTLFNTLVKEDRVVVSDQPHTTTTATTHELIIQHNSQSVNFSLIDTAGIRKKNKVNPGIESLAIIQSLKMINESEVVIYLIDGTQEIGQQDIQLIDLCLRRGVSVVMAINKIDHMDEYQKRMIQMNIRDRCRGIDHVPIVFISALANRRVRTLERQLLKIYESRTFQSNSALLTRILKNATQTQAPPMVSGRRPRLQFAHPQSGRKLVIVIQGKRLQQLNGSYIRYLAEYFRKRLKLIGTNVLFKFKQDDNPYDP